MRLSTFVMGALAVGSHAVIQAQTPKLPNIIFLMDDQHRWDALGIVDRQVKTPNLDRLARQGVLFNQAVCQAPMSVASRNSLMLGLYPNQIGTLRNEPGLPDEKLPSRPLVEVIRDAGYETAGFGKAHWGITVGTRGFETRYEAECRENGAIMMADVDPEKYKRYNEEIADFGPGEENNLGYIGCTSQLQENEHRDGWLTEKCLEYLESRDDERPLFLYLSFYKPHAGHNVPEKFERMYSLEKTRYAEQPDWDRDDSPHAEQVNRRDMYIDFWKNATDTQWKQMTLRYRANCTWLDDMFGRVLDELKKKGLLDNALIIYLSDHGEMLGERYYRFNKYCLYESSVRVPIIFSGSALPDDMKRTVDSRPVELVDIYTTLMHFVGEQVPNELPGIDLLSDETRPANFCALHERPTEAAFMWRTPEYKLILCMKRKADASMYTESDIIDGEFYDLQQDSQEWNNKYHDKSYEMTIARMKQELLAHLKTLKRMPPKYVEYR